MKWLGLILMTVRQVLEKSFKPAPHAVYYITTSSVTHTFQKHLQDKQRAKSKDYTSCKLVERCFAKIELEVFKAHSS